MHGLAVTLGKKGVSRSVTEEGKYKLAKMLTEEQFVSLATFKLTDLDNYLTKPQREEVMETSHTNRSIKVTSEK